MTHEELQQTLTEFAAERVALLQRHEAAARIVSHYDFNNAYQYVIAREETHLTWLQNALAEFRAPLPGPSRTLPVPEVGKGGRDGAQVEPSRFRAVLEDDARLLHAFVDEWRPRLDAVSHARHRLMLNVVLGESLEHARLFEQAASGIEDVLGRRTAPGPRIGHVMATRWVE